MSISQLYCHEITDENGALTDFYTQYPPDFNFGYDVVDLVAEKEPDKRALVWCNVEGEEHIFSFSDIKKYSNKMANVFLSQGIGRGNKGRSIYGAGKCRTLFKRQVLRKN